MGGPWSRRYTWLHQVGSGGDDSTAAVDRSDFASLRSETTPSVARPSLNRTTESSERPHSRASNRSKTSIARSPSTQGATWTSSPSSNSASAMVGRRWTSWRSPVIVDSQRLRLKNGSSRRPVCAAHDSNASRRFWIRQLWNSLRPTRVFDLRTPDPDVGDLDARRRFESLEAFECTLLCRAGRRRRERSDPQLDSPR